MCLIRSLNTDRTCMTRNWLKILLQVKFQESFIETLLLPFKTRANPRYFCKYFNTHLNAPDTHSHSSIRKVVSVPHVNVVVSRMFIIFTHISTHIRLVIVCVCFWYTYLAKMNNSTETPKYAVAIYIQTSSDNGDKNENKFGGCLTGLRYNTEMPKFINGIVKSTTCNIYKKNRHKVRERYSVCCALW